MRPHGKIRLGFFPLPVPEAERLKHCLAFPSEFCALDPCVGDGVAFSRLLEGTRARRYGIEIDANRADQATRLGIDTLHANTMDVRCPAEALSLLYLNPPYDFETGQANNQRLELVFLEHTYRWLKPGGVLLFVIPQPQLRQCARILSEHFSDLSVFRLTEPSSVQYKQVALLGLRRKRNQHLRDSALLNTVRRLEMLANKNLAQDLSMVAIRGRIIVIGNRGNIEINPRDAMSRDASIIGMTLFNTSEMDLARIHAALGAALENGIARPVISKELPLAEAGPAQQEVMKPGSYGKIVLVP